MSTIEAISTERALKLALEALEDVRYYGWGETKRDYDARTAAITALREALASEAIEQPCKQDIQRLSALVRAQQITIDKLEAQLQARSAETREKNCD